MICDKVKECSEKTRHIPPSEKAKQNKGKNAKNRKQKKEDIYQYPLGKSPRIRNTEEYMGVKEAFYKRKGIKIAEEKMAEEYDELERLRGK